MDRITPCLWFDTEAEEAAQFYTSVFPNSRIVRVTHYGSAGPRPEGMVMEVEFELDGRSVLALNGGPEFRFTEAISLQADCKDQDEVDRLWETLSRRGGRAVRLAQGPLRRLLAGRAEHPLRADRRPRRERAQRAIAAMLQMRKIVIDELERAADGVPAR